MKISAQLLQKILQAMDEVEFFFVIFYILGSLGCPGWVIMPKNGKNANITAPY